MAVFGGFKNFLMQGQLVVGAVGPSIAPAFSVLVQTFTRSDGLPLEATKCRYCATELTVEESGGLAEPP